MWNQYICPFGSICLCLLFYPAALFDPILITLFCALIPSPRPHTLTFCSLLCFLLIHLWELSMITFSLLPYTAAVMELHFRSVTFFGPLQRGTLRALEKKCWKNRLEKKKNPPKIQNQHQEKVIIGDQGRKLLLLDSFRVYNLSQLLSSLCLPLLFSVSVKLTPSPRFILSRKLNSERDQIQWQSQQQLNPSSSLVRHIYSLCSLLWDMFPLTSFQRQSPSMSPPRWSHLCCSSLYLCCSVMSGGAEVAPKHVAISALLVTLTAGDLQAERKNRKIAMFQTEIRLSPHDLQRPQSTSFSPKWSNYLLFIWKTHFPFFHFWKSRHE